MYMEFRVSLPQNLMVSPGVSDNIDTGVRDVSYRAKQILKSQNILCNNTWLPVPGFNFAITLKNANNIVEITANICVLTAKTGVLPASSISFAWKRVVGGKSQFIGYNRLASGNVVGANFGFRNIENHILTVCGSAIDKPASNLVIGYQLYVRGNDKALFFINGDGAFNLYNELYISTIKIQELAGDIEYMYDSSEQQEFIEII